MTILLSLLYIVVGFVLLIWSAKKFIDGSSGLAYCLGVPELIIGILIVGFGTSAPEMLVSLLAAMDNSPGLALGNAWGSNICNISLILGVTALLTPVVVSRSLLKKEYPLLLFVVILPLYFVYDGDISRTESLVLLLIIAGFIVHTTLDGVRKSREEKKRKSMVAAVESANLSVDNQNSVSDSGNEEDEIPKNLGLGKSSLMALMGLVVMVASSKLIVLGAVDIATILKINDIVIGLTVVAVGTSLPELAASVVAARKGCDELAVGNIIGSNIFNSTAVIGIAGVVAPFSVDKMVMVRDGGITLFLTLSLIIFSISFRSGTVKLGRFHGVFWLTVYVAYTSLLVYTALNGDNPPEWLAFLKGEWL